MDQQGNEIPFRTDLDHSFAIVIPPMSLINVTGHQGFHFHSLDLTQLPSSRVFPFIGKCSR